VTSVLPCYRNVFAFLGGAFEAQTPYLRRKGLSPDIGGSILEVTFNKEGTSVIRYRYEWVPYFVPIEKDY